MCRPVRQRRRPKGIARGLMCQSGPALDVRTRDHTRSLSSCCRQFPLLAHLLLQAPSPSLSPPPTLSLTLFLQASISYRHSPPYSNPPPNSASLPPVGGLLLSTFINSFCCSTSFPHFSPAQSTSLGALHIIIKVKKRAPKSETGLSSPFKEIYIHPKDPEGTQITKFLHKCLRKNSQVLFTKQFQCTGDVLTMCLSF